MRKSFRLTIGMRSEDTLTAARSYARAGLKVLPLHGITKLGRCTCENKACSNPGKHPDTRFFPKGVHSATTDIPTIEAAFKANPTANIGIALDGLTVVDRDSDEGRKFISKAKLPRTLMVKTSRGVHKYYDGALPGGSYKMPGVDILSGDRYVVAPPSIHASGHIYSWIDLDIRDAAPVPESLIDLRPRKKFEKKDARHIPEGQRNDELFRLACSLRRRVKDEKALLAMMEVANESLCDRPLPEKELYSLITSSERYPHEVDELFGPPQEREPLPMEWLWYRYIPRHAVTLIVGDPGRGKSLLTALLIATVTSGKKWPLSSDRPTGNRVLLLSAEDSWARVTLHRLRKAGANIDNMEVMHKFRALTPERLELLAEKLASWKPDLVVIDTLSAYMGGKRDMNRQNEVGEFLAMLTEMAEATGAAVVGLAHLNKQSAEHPLYRVVGSIGFMASVRSALFLGTDPENRSRLALAHGKSNASEKGKTIIFELAGGGKDDAPVLKPIGFSEADENDVCRIERRPVGRPDSEHAEAAAFVLERITDEPVAWEMIRKAAEAHGIASEGTLNIVRAELAKDGRIIQVGKGRKAKWKRGDTHCED